MKDLVGPYRILRPLGHGGMGSVYLGVHDHLGREVAIKALAPELTRHPQFRERFFAEARVQARLQHTNIVTIYDLIEDEGSFFIVMELVPGPTLETLLKEGEGRGWEVGPALALFRQILAGLDYAHSKGVIHRDVKPSNVLVAEGDQAKLTDFGIALLVGDKRLTASQSTIGTPIYMSPEQILRPLWVDHRSDVYSAAIVLYEMLAGRPPFDAATEYEIKKLQIEAPVPDLRAIDSRVPAAVAEAISTALRKDPDDRFPSAGAFLRALRNDPVIVPVREVSREEPSPLPDPPQARLPRPAIAAAAVLLALIGLVFLVFILRESPAEPPPVVASAPPAEVPEPAVVPQPASVPVETVAQYSTPLAAPPPVVESRAPEIDAPVPAIVEERPADPAPRASAIPARDRAEEAPVRVSQESQAPVAEPPAEPSRDSIEESRELNPPGERTIRKLTIEKVEIRPGVVAPGGRAVAYATATVQPPFQQPMTVDLLARVMRNLEEVAAPIYQSVTVPAGGRTLQITIPIQIPQRAVPGDCYIDVTLRDAAREVKGSRRIGFTIQ